MFARRLAIALSFLFFIFLAPSAHALDGFVEVTAPNGGTYTEGDLVNITWNSSDNIDKVSIMYKTDAHHGNWVAFTTDNTGSYPWKIDVGNTTNTQFYIEITGYETGTGSTTDFGEYFTVNQAPDAPSLPTSTPTATPTPSPTKYSYPTPTPTPTLPPRIVSPRLSIYTLILWSEFIFEGSSTTDLSSIADPSHVENFTLDTQAGFTFVFAGVMDFTNSNNLAAIDNLEDNWEWSSWLIWIHQEWWVKYEIEQTIEVTYENEDLTGYEPNVVADNPNSDSASSNYPEPSWEVLGSSTGEVKLALNSGAKLTIEPHVELDQDSSLTTASSELTLTGHTSHNNLIYSGKLNGHDLPPLASEQDSATGELTFKISNLTEGNNSLQLYYAQEGGEPIEFADLNILYRPNPFTSYSFPLLTLFGALLLSFVAVVIALYQSKFKSPLSQTPQK